jgi:hypothetical protein
MPCSILVSIASGPFGTPRYAALAAERAAAAPHMADAA